MKLNRLFSIIVLIVVTGALIKLVNSQIINNNKITFTKEMETIKLNKPIIDTKNELLVALKNRQSLRNMSNKEISPQILSEVLWAVCGYNRDTGGHHGEGGHTAPIMWDVKVHVAMENGVYKYNPKETVLEKVLDDDIRNKMTVQEFTHKAPAILIFSLDTADMTESWVETTGGKDFYAGATVSYMSQNVYLYCASKKISTVAMALIHNDFINSKLNLTGTEHTYLVQPIGYPEK